MKLVIQRVNFAKVEVNNEVVGEISKGILVFVGISSQYDESKLEWALNKVLKLRLWAKDDKGFRESVLDRGYDILVVSQFTLFGDCSNSNKPNFKDAMEFDKAKGIYDEFVSKLEESGLKVETGAFGEMMIVSLENDGPVTIILEK